MDCSKCITPTVKQTWCVSAVLICVVGQGMVFGHTTCLLMGLQKPDSSIKLDLDSASWLASSTGSATLVGITINWVILDKYGRKTAFLLALLPAIAGWLMIYFAQSFLELLIGRILLGSTLAAGHGSGAIVIGEYTSPEYRGMFLNLKTAGITVGSALIHILNKFMDWKTLALISVIPYVLSLLITFTWPESPSWLASKKHFAKCKKSFFWLRGTDERSVWEITELVKQQKEKLSAHQKYSFAGRLFQFLKRFKKKDFLKPLAIGVIGMLLLDSTGRQYFPAYALQIMSEIITSDKSPHYYTFAVDIITVTGVLLSTVLVRLIKRRTLLFSTGIASLVILAVICIYLFLISLDVLSNIYPMLIVSLLATYFFFINLGCIPLSAAFSGELFPLAHRETLLTIQGFTFSIFLTGVLKLTPYLLYSTKVYGTFAFYGGIITILLVVLYFILPETKDRTLQEIENYFRYGNFRNDEADGVHLKMMSGDDNVN